MDATAIVLTGPGDVELQTYELGEVQPDELLVRTEFSGVSQGTELDAYRGDRPELSYPTVTGYQAVGTVEKVGTDVQGFETGQRVLFTTSRLPKRYPETWMASHVSHALVSTRVRPPLLVPDEVDPVEAALTAMVAVGLAGIQQIEVGIGDVVLVNGQGLIGQGSAQLARQRGAVVVTTDLSPTRSRLSGQHSADVALTVGDDDLDAVLAELAPDGVDVVIETTGRADQFAPSIDRLRAEGTLLLQGYYKQPIGIDFHPTHVKKPTIAVACGFGALQLPLSLLRWRKIRLAPLVTHLAPPKQAAELFERMAQSDPDVLGVVFDWSAST